MSIKRVFITAQSPENLSVKAINKKIIIAPPFAHRRMVDLPKRIGNAENASVIALPCGGVHVCMFELDRLVFENRYNHLTSRTEFTRLGVITFLPALCTCVYCCVCKCIVFFPVAIAIQLGLHDDVIKWKHFPRYWPFVRGIHHTKASDTELSCFLWSAPE